MPLSKDCLSRDKIIFYLKIIGVRYPNPSPIPQNCDVNATKGCDALGFAGVHRQ